jgi:hypothetical protein
MKVLWCSIGVFALISGFAFAECRKPNNNLKACADPNNNAETCWGFDEAHCSGFRLYEINQFPDGDVDDDKLQVHSPQENCYRFRACTRDIQAYGCIPTGYSPWMKKAKVSNNGNCAT